MAPDRAYGFQEELICSSFADLRSIRSFHSDRLTARFSVRCGSCLLSADSVKNLLFLSCLRRAGRIAEEWCEQVQSVAHGGNLRLKCRENACYHNDQIKAG